MFGNPPNHFLRDFEDMFGQFLKCFSQLFEDTGNLEKCNPSNAKPLFLSIRWQSFSSCFHTFFKTSSRTGILSIFDRILVILGLHLETFASTFGSHFFRSQKSQKSFFEPAPGLRLSATPPGEGGNWQTSRRHLGGGHLGGIWEARCQRRPGGGSGGKCAQTTIFSINSGASGRFACMRAQ